jgi:hypothetical protein
MVEQTLPMELPVMAPPPPDFGPVLVGKPRPGCRDGIVVEAAARAVLPEVMDWLKPDDSPEDEVLGDIKDAICGGGDGYEMTKYLEDRKHWDCDSEMVGILDGVDLWSPHDRLVKQWVAANRIRPALGEGASVAHRRHGAGRIVGIREDTAEYTVLFSKDAGKVAGGHIGTIIPFEDIDS